MARFALRVLAVAMVTAVFVVPASGPRSGGVRADHLVDQVPGYDISWPQCRDQAYPPAPIAFMIVGINGGRPFTPNPCFPQQYRWSQRFERHPAVYVNVDYPREGRDEPARTGPYGTCTDQEGEADDRAYEWCRAYNYGYAIGDEVVRRAEALAITPSFWWLDVETGNYWSNDPTFNAQVIRATLDFFRQRSLPVGIYSTPRQWRIIAGQFAPGVPVWTAGARGIDDARRRCLDPAYAFAGGTVVLSQYYDHGFDTNYACPDGHPIAQFTDEDLYGREGPKHRSLSLEGTVLPHWDALPLLSMD